MKSAPSTNDILLTTPIQQDSRRSKKQAIGLGLLGVALAVALSAEVDVAKLESSGIKSSGLIGYVWFLGCAGLIFIADSISISLRYFVASSAVFSGLLIITVVNNPGTKIVEGPTKDDNHFVQSPTGDPPSIADNTIHESCSQMLEMFGPLSSLYRPKQEKNEHFKKYVYRPFSWKLKVHEVRSDFMGGYTLASSCVSDSSWVCEEPEPRPRHGKDSKEQKNSGSCQSSEGKDVTNDVVQDTLIRHQRIEIRFDKTRKDFLDSLQKGKVYEFKGTLDSHLSMIGLSAIDRIEN